MRTHAIAFVAIGAFATAGLAGGCGDDPVSRLPPRPSTPFITSVDITGPDTIAPGQSAQYTATVRFSDGTRKSAVAAATAGLQWSTNNSSVLRVDASGVATAQQRLSETTLRLRMPKPTGARGSFIESTREIVVVPSGTFRIVGVVNDETPSAPLAGARVEVAAESLVALTDFSGQYRLYGVPPDAEIRVTRDGYEAAVQQLQLTSHARRDFHLKLAAPRIVLNGPYRLEIEASGCVGLPADLRRRQYNAVLTQNGPIVEVVLTNPLFRPNGSGRGDRFTGRVGPTAAAFTLEPFFVDYYYYFGSTYPSVAEQLSNGTYFVVQGSVVAAGSAAGVSGPLTGGGLFNWDSRWPNVAFLVQSCTSPVTLTLTPR